MIKKGKEVVRIETNAISDLTNSIDDEFVKALQILYECKGRVVLTGMGKSGLIARKIVATLNSTGTASIYLHPTDALHGDLGMVRKEDVVIMISKSGATEELANLIPMLKRLNVKLIAMAGNKDSRLRAECDVLLNISVKEEACPFDLAPTSSSTAALVMGDALAVVLLQMREFTEEDFAVLHPGGSLGKRLSLSIKEIMHKGDSIPVVNEDASIKDVIFEISSKRLGTTTVVDKNGCLAGVVTDGDLRRLLEKTMDIKSLKAKDIMTRNPKVMKDHYLASFALQTMENFKITTLIIIDDLSIPAGIIHLHDLVNLGLRQR
ncbi:MAG: D-arabinose 5-phosphate isomerase [Ignavibacteria bacterium GWA2_35_9]|nr:MAG: D-arabinose 5-phosphate isomerase [Ignavibacteria bacterium GWA2_35_9]OGU45605.1 MAG: D-arabinose 5-phosphate isomerase [Ignavibacteria bacterium GWB2_36_8]OGU50418.1 MAG: D-arabinose 5-phosphate isomerase [Ignavibacteria bacterium GWC2_36_12]OGU94296.1 MAG: D-arabinose 5-phosphate isomerase [Ignavibacteria bacterium RIFOXYB2_FULL_36_7]